MSEQAKPEGFYQRWVRETQPRMYWGENGSLMVREDVCRQYIIGAAVYVAALAAIAIAVLAF